jgi:hypothetical protein
MSARWTALILPLALLASGCDQNGSASTTANSGGTGGTSGATAANGERIHLEARFSQPSGPFGRAAWKVRPRNGSVAKKFQLEIGRAEPGAVLAVTVDGARIGDLRIDLDGEGELEFDGGFPATLAEPRAGSIVRVGDLIEITLAPVERLVSLAGSFRGAVAGEVKYRVERIGDLTVREFALEITKGPASQELTVSIDSIGVGSVSIDEEGEGDLIYMDGGEDPFPDGFPNPQAGSLIRLGDAAEIALVPQS